MINRAVKRRLDRSAGLLFPERALHGFRSKAINQQKPGWEKTLTGLPKEMYQLWYNHLRPRGYKLRYQVVDFPGGVPGDIGITLSWRQVQ